MHRSEGAGTTVKRVTDVVAAAAGLLILSPVLAATAIVLWMTQGRPILFRQIRPGLHGRPFRIAKFRTMRPTREGEVAHQTDQLRVTRIGRILRSTSLDELPELWNVLRGEMSLVGPRPLLPEYLDAYSDREKRRHDIRPGVTSWAAVNGRHTLRFDERLELDVWYVEHQSFRLDLKILGMTLRQLVSREHVVTTQDPDEIGFPLPGGARGSTTDIKSGQPGADDSDGPP